MSHSSPVRRDIPATDTRIVADKPHRVREHISINRSQLLTLMLLVVLPWLLIAGAATIFQ